MHTEKNKIKKFLKLKYWREYLSKDQGDMAILLGCGRSNYCEKENGNISFSLKEAIIIQQAFNKELKKMGRAELTMDDIFLH